MECKAFFLYHFVDVTKNWNISRMECKAASFYPNIIHKTIGIYPEWNVKYIMNSNRYMPVGQIGIYPEWNVKAIFSAFFKCRFIIGIYPEWNVKLSKLSSTSVFTSIGIYP